MFSPNNIMWVYKILDGNKIIHGRGKEEIKSRRFGMKSSYYEPFRVHPVESLSSLSGCIEFASVFAISDGWERMKL